MTAPTVTSISMLRRKFNSLAKRFRLDYGEFECHGAIEYGSTNGKLNFHVLFYGQYMPNAYVSRAAGRRGIGIIADIQEVKSAEAAVVYLAKDLIGYLAKDQGAAGRSITSAGWLPVADFDERLQVELAKARHHRKDNRGLARRPRPSRPRVPRQGRTGPVVVP